MSRAKREINYSNHLSAVAVADILSISAGTVRKLIARGDLVATEINGRYYVTEKSLESFLQSRLERRPQCAHG